MCYFNADIYSNKKKDKKMSDKNIPRLFKKKAGEHASDLGVALSDVHFDALNNRYVQLFKHGVIIGHMNKLTMSKRLICVYGKLFHAWWDNKDAEWLGKPLEDLFTKTNAEGHEIMVQRFENGVINCRSDGGNNVQWLSWHDWHVISHPKDVSNKHP